MSTQSIRESRKRSGGTNGIPLSMDADMVRDEIRLSMREAELTQVEWAFAHGVSESYLSDILSGRREPGAKLLSSIGMKRVTYYEYEQTP